MFRDFATVFAARRKLALLALLFAGVAPAVTIANEEKFTVQCKSEDGFLHVYSDNAVDPARCKAVAARALKAFAFVTERAGWKDRSILTAKPLEFALVGNDHMKILGYAKGPNLMVMKNSYMDDPLSEGTLSHELTHIQDLRQLQGKRLPSFMLEGRALTIGQAYRLNVGQKPGDYDSQMARSAVGFTAEKAMELLDNYGGQGWDNQAIGTVVVEYMRTQWKGGIADINPRLSRVIERMAAGREFDQAFQDEFGVSAEAFAEDFARFLRATQGDAKRRLQGTMWQSVALEGRGKSSGGAGNTMADAIADTVADAVVDRAVNEALDALLGW
jgi:hypothetical protein